MLSDVKHPRYYLYLAILMATVFSLSSTTKTNYPRLWVNNTTVSDPDIQSKTGRNQNINKNLATPETYKNANSTNMPGIATSPPVNPLIPKSKLEPFTMSDVRSSPLTIPSIKNPGKNHTELFKKDVCEENNYRMVMLACLIIIAVLFLICTILFLSTVVLANKVSSLKRAKQVGKRQPRSNGDFLASSGLWPAESDTWKRAQQLTGPNLILQSTGVLTMTRERKDGEGTGKLTN